MSSPDRVWSPGFYCSRGPSTFLPPSSLVIYLSCIPLLNELQIFFLMLPQTGFYPLKKKNANFYTFRKKILFSDFFFFFQIPPHYLWEGRKTLCACRGMCNENFKDTHFQVKRTRGHRSLYTSGVKWKPGRLICIIINTEGEKHKNTITARTTSIDIRNCFETTGATGLTQGQSWYPKLLSYLSAQSCSSAKLIVYQAASPAQGSD